MCVRQAGAGIHGPVSLRAKKRITTRPKPSSFRPRSTPSVARKRKDPAPIPVSASHNGNVSNERGCVSQPTQTAFRERRETPSGGRQFPARGAERNPSPIRSILVEPEAAPARARAGHSPWRARRKGLGSKDRFDAVRRDPRSAAGRLGALGRAGRDRRATGIAEGRTGARAPGCGRAGQSAA